MPPRRWIRASWKRCCPISRKSSATPPAAITRLDGQAEEAVENGARADRQPDRRDHRKKSSSPRGATESDNLAIKGVAEMYREKGNHIITAATEHKAVLDTCKRLEKVRLPRDLSAGAERRPDRSRRSQARHRRQDDPGHDHVLPTTKSASCSRGARSASSATSAAFCSTRTRCRRSAKFRST